MQVLSIYNIQQNERLGGKRRKWGGEMRRVGWTKDRSGVGKIITESTCAEW